MSSNWFIDPKDAERVIVVPDRLARRIESQGPYGKAIRRLRQLHCEWEGECEECESPYPCNTIMALEGAP